MICRVIPRAIAIGWVTFRPGIPNAFDDFTLRGLLQDMMRLNLTSPVCFVNGHLLRNKCGHVFDACVVCRMC